MSWKDEVRKVGTSWQYDPKSLPKIVQYSGACPNCAMYVQRGMKCPINRPPPGLTQAESKDSCPMQIPMSTQIHDKKQEKKSFDSVIAKAERLNALPMVMSPEATLQQIEDGALSTKGVKIVLNRLLESTDDDWQFSNVPDIPSLADAKGIARELLSKLEDAPDSRFVKFNSLMEQFVTGEHDPLLDYLDKEKMPKQTFSDRKITFREAREKFDATTTGTKIKDYINDHPELKESIVGQLLGISLDAPPDIDEDDLNPYLLAYLDFLLQSPMNSREKAKAFPKKKDGSPFVLVEGGKLKIVAALRHIMAPNRIKLDLDKTDFAYRKEEKIVHGQSMRGQEISIIDDLTSNYRNPTKASYKEDDLVQNTFNQLVRVKASKGKTGVDLLSGGSAGGYSKAGIQKFLTEMRNPSTTEMKAASKVYNQRIKDTGIIKIAFSEKDWSAMVNFLDPKNQELRTSMDKADRETYKEYRKELSSLLPIGSYKKGDIDDIISDSRKTIGELDGFNILDKLPSDGIKRKVANSDYMKHPLIHKMYYETAGARQIIRERYGPDIEGKYKPEKEAYKKTHTLLSDGKFHPRILLVEDIIELLAFIETGYHEGWELNMKIEALKNETDEFDEIVDDLITTAETNFKTLKDAFSKALKKTILQQYSKNEVVEAWVDKTVGQ